MSHRAGVSVQSRSGEEDWQQVFTAEKSTSGRVTDLGEKVSHYVELGNFSRSCKKTNTRSNYVLKH